MQPPIADGQDGVEMAVPLADLDLRPGQSFDLLCREYAQDDEDLINRRTIHAAPARK